MVGLRLENGQVFNDFNGEHYFGEAGPLVVPPPPSFGPYRQLLVTF